MESIVSDGYLNRSNFNKFPLMDTQENEEYTLQVTPKKIHFKIETNYTKIYTCLHFGDHKFKPPHPRFIRNNQGTFYGERLTLNNTSQHEAYLQVEGVNHRDQKIVLLKISLNIRDLIECGKLIACRKESEQLIFEYEVLMTLRDMSEEFYQEIEGITGQEIDSEPILLHLASSQQEGRTMKQLEAQQDIQPQGSVHSFRKLEELVHESIGCDEAGEQSPIRLKSYESPKFNDNFSQNSHRSEENPFLPKFLHPQAQTSFEKSETEDCLSDKTVESLTCQSIEVQLAPPKTSFSWLLLAEYFAVSLFCFYMGVCVGVQVQQL